MQPAGPQSADPAAPSVDSLDEIAATILRYVLLHPNACDTLDGITDWWLPRQRCFEARADVQSALERLTASGRLEARAGADGNVVYRAVTPQRADGDHV